MDQSLPAAPDTPLSNPPPVANPSVPPVTAPIGSDPLPQPPSPKPSNLKKILLLAVVFLVIFVSLILSFFYLKGSNEKIKSEAAVTTVPEATPKILTIGTDATFPPMESLTESGDFAGFDIDVGRTVGQDLGYQVVFKHYPWVNLFPALLDHKIDLIMSSVSITDERKKLYLFSDPYFNAGQVIIILKTNTTIQKPESLKGKKVAVTPNTTNEIEAKKYTDPKNVIGYEDNEVAVKDLKRGVVQAMIQDLSGAKGIVDLHPELKIAGDPFTTENYGIVLAKDNTNLVRRINDSLKRQREKGVLDEIRYKWFE